MAKKENDTDNVVEILKAGHFGKEPAIPASVDPVMETPLVLTLDQLVEYDRNPRNAPNSEYETLKASYIKTGAANTLLVVTKRPGEEFYFPAAGGNTRLRVLRELWDEFHDERYYRVHCKFIPYENETKIQIAHLNENDNRGDIIFIDRAKVLIRIYDEMRDDNGGNLSKRAFIQQVQDQGYSKLSRGQLERFEIAVKLYKSIPQALDAGMQVRAIVRLKETHDKLKEFMDLASGGVPEISAEFDRFWNLILEDLDSPDGIDLEDVTQRIFESLAPTAATRFPELDDGQIIARLNHLWPQWRDDRTLSVSLRQGSASRRDDPVSTRAGPAHRYTDEERETYSRETHYPDSPTSQGPRDQTEHSGNVPSGDSDPSPGMFVPPSEAAPPGTGGPSISDGESSPSDSIERKQKQLDELSLESSAYARSIAESWDIVDLFYPLEFGAFYFIDLPDPKREMSSFTRMAWWLLWDSSTITASPDTIPQLMESHLKGTRIARNWLDIADGRASSKKQELDALPPGKRNATILKIFKNVVNSTVAHPTDFAAFLVTTEKSNYEPLHHFISLHRKGYQVVLSMAEEMRAGS